MFYGPECGLSWWVLRVSLRRKCVLLWDEVVCRCAVSPAGKPCCWVQLLLTDFLPAGSVLFWWGAWKSPTVIVDSSGSPCSAICFHLTLFNALLLDIHMIRTIMSSWRIDPFIIMLWLCLSPITSFLWKLPWNSHSSCFLLISVSIVYPHPFTFSL